jgi:hypothetical protein
MALHKLLLDKKDHYEENFILLLQKFLANGTHEYPNKHSMAFLQALKYSINEFYQLPHCDNNEAFVARLFSLPGHTTPTLELFDILLKDFISKTPQGKWSSHEHEMSHYKFMYSKHQEVKEAINDNIYRSVINTVMGSVIKNLYFLLGVFRDHTKIQAIEFFAEESAFMEVLKSAHPIGQSYQSLFNAEETDKFHVRSSLRDSERTSAMYVQMEFIRILHNLKAYMQNAQMTIEEFEQYIIKNTKEKEHPFQDPIEDFVIFLVELRERIYCGNGAQQMLGIGFEGSFFKAPISHSFSDNPTIHLCFTEKFRIAGSVFLWHMTIQGLCDQLSTEFGQLIRILVDSSVDSGLKLTYHYAMLKMWHEVIHNSTSVDDTLATKLRSLVNTELKAKMNQDPSNPKSKESLDHIEAYIIACGGTLETLKAINHKLNPPKSQKKSVTNPMTLDIAEQKILVLDF